MRFTLLRMILCFWVIAFHFGGTKNKKKYKILKTFFHVPTFMIISFYYSYKLFIPNNILKIKQRLERLFIPFIIIPFIKFGIILLREYSRINKKELFSNLILQYLTGYKIIIPLWFLHILFIFNILFEIIFLLFPNKYLFVLQILAIISYWFQYSEINYKIFHKCKPHLRSVSHWAEMIPIAVTGLTIGYIKLLDSLKNYRIKAIASCIVILCFIYNYNIFGKFKGFNYSGIKQNIAAICLFISFFLIQFEKIINNKLYLNIIKGITRYTGGIYYFHPIIYYILKNIKYLKDKSILTCFIIYLIGYFICLVGTKIFTKTKFKYLFN